MLFSSAHNARQQYVWLQVKLLLNSKFNLVTWCQSFNGLEKIVAEAIHATVTFSTESMAFKVGIHYYR